MRQRLTVMLEQKGGRFLLRPLRLCFSAFRPVFFRAVCETNPIEANRNRGWRAGIKEMFHRRARAGDDTKPTP